MIEIDFLRTAFSKSCSSFAFLTLEGELILVESKSGAEFLSCVHTARFVAKYFPLDDQDWVAVNDPQSGGYNPFGISFVGRLGNILWSVRVEKAGAWNTTDKWETLGLRLPPIPFKIKGEHNPQVPAIFLDKVIPFENMIAQQYEKLAEFISWKMDALSPNHLKKYFELSRRTLAEKLNDTPWTEAHHKSKTKTGEILSTKVVITQEQFAVDLSGSSPTQSLGLTESMTDSLVTYAGVQALQCQSYYNSGTEKYFQITKPRVSWLSVREPSYPAHVQFLGFPFVESHLKQHLLKMKFPVQTWKCSIDGWMQLQFPNKALVTSDDLQKNWGHSLKGLKLLRTEENSLVFEITEACRLFRVESGDIEIHELRPGAQFQLSLEY